MTEMNGGIATFILVLIIGSMCFGAYLFAGYIVDYKAQHDVNNDIPQQSPENLYGCPGCPSSYMEFAEDMCSRVGPEYTVSDGTNTLKCSELGVKR